MTAAIAWTNERRQLSQLIPWPRNPRQINREQAKRLEDSFTEFGQVETVAIGPNNEVYNGHQRLNVLAAKYGKDYEVEVRVSSRPLTEKEREKLTVYLHKGAAGEWNFDVLANEFEIPDLIEWGFKPYELGIPGTDEDEQTPDDLWKGMPEFEQESREAFKSVTVHFANPVDMEEFAKLLNQTITEKTKSIWYPEKKRENLMPYRCQDES